MATRGKKISEQTLATSLDGNEIIPFVKNGADGAVKASKIKDFAKPDLTSINNAIAGKVDKVQGKELSTNDFTDEEKQKLDKLPSNKQFNKVGYYLLSSGAYTLSSAYATSGIIPINRSCDIVFKSWAIDAASSIAFFDQTGQYISGSQSTAGEETTITKDNIPQNAVYFAVSTPVGYVPRCYYRNGDTIESREGAVSDAILSSADVALIADATAAGAVYNNKTGYFELNGLVDITEAQMRIILRNPQRPPFNVFSSTSQRAKLRTNLWEASPQSTHDVTIQSKGVFSGWLAAEVINLDNGATDVFATKINGYDTFKACTELHTILGDFSFGNGATTDTTFASCFKLRSFRLYGVNYDIDLHWSPLIAVESLQYLVTNAANTSSITVTVHPDVYAKLTGDTTNAAAAALTASELAQWQQVATNAAAKNIAFATSN